MFTQTQNLDTQTTSPRWVTSAIVTSLVLNLALAAIVFGGPVLGTALKSDIGNGFDQMLTDSTVTNGTQPAVAQTASATGKNCDVEFGCAGDLDKAVATQAAVNQSSGTGIFSSIGSTVSDVGSSIKSGAGSLMDGVGNAFGKTGITGGDNKLVDGAVRTVGDAALVGGAAKLLGTSNSTAAMVAGGTAAASLLNQNFGTGESLIGAGVNGVKNLFGGSSSTQPDSTEAAVIKELDAKKKPCVGAKIIGNQGLVVSNQATSFPGADKALSQASSAQRGLMDNMPPELAQGVQGGAIGGAIGAAMGAMNKGNILSSLLKGAAGGALGQVGGNLAGNMLGLDASTTNTIGNVAAGAASGYLGGGNMKSAALGGVGGLAAGGLMDKTGILSSANATQNNQSIFSQLTGNTGAASQLTGNSLGGKVVQDALGTQVDSTGRVISSATSTAGQILDPRSLPTGSYRDNLGNVFAKDSNGIPRQIGTINPQGQIVGTGGSYSAAPTSQSSLETLVNSALGTTTASNTLYNNTYQPTAQIIDPRSLPSTTRVDSSGNVSVPDSAGIYRQIGKVNSQKQIISTQGSYNTNTYGNYNQGGYPYQNNRAQQAQYQQPSLGETLIKAALSK